MCVLLPNIGRQCCTQPTCMHPHDSRCLHPAGSTLTLSPACTCAAVLLYRFNLRVAECRLAAVLLAHLLCAAGPQHKGLDWQNVNILQQVEAQLKQYAALQCSGTNTSSSSSGGGNGADCGEALAAAVRQLLPQEAYTLDQVRR